MNVRPHYYQALVRLFAEDGSRLRDADADAGDAIEHLNRATMKVTVTVSGRNFLTMSD